MKFNNKKFKILHITDMHEYYPANPITIGFDRETVKNEKPDLVVLGGDNTFAFRPTQEDSIREICSIFTELNVPFTTVFGNHDHEQGYNNHRQLTMYRKYAGDLFLGKDEDPTIDGASNHHIELLDSEGKKTIFNLWFFDSHSYTWDETGNDIGYDSVHPNQIEWYKRVEKELTAKNNGVPVPSFVFQHIIVSEIFPALFKTAKEAPECDKKRSSVGIEYAMVLKEGALKEGGLNEWPCSGVRNHGQFDAIRTNGKPLAFMSGHDHVNDFIVPYKGVDIVNTPSSTLTCYSNNKISGIRVLTLDEDDLSTYSTRIVRLIDYAPDLKFDHHYYEYARQTANKQEIIRRYTADIERNARKMKEIEDALKED